MMKIQRLALLALVLLADASCQTVPTKPATLGAGIAVVTTPPNNTPAWFIDTLSTSGQGCAADTNNGQSATCNGSDITGTKSGPLLTFNNLRTAKFNCPAASQFCPVLQASTTITWLSQPAANTDPVYLFPVFPNGGTLTLVNPPPNAQYPAPASNVPAPGTPTYNPTWYAQTNIYWDPAGTAGGADTNSCVASGAPCLTFAEIVRRYGSNRPIYNYGQTTTVFQLTSQPAGQDPVTLEATVSGGGQSNLTATMTSSGATFAAGTLGGGYGYSGAVQSAGGTEMTIGSVPAYVVAGVLLQNTTRASYTFVDSVTTGTAKVAQPHTVASLTSQIVIPAPIADNDWVAGDTIQAWTLPNLNLISWTPVATDRTAGSVPSGSFVTFANVADTSGTGRSSFGINSRANVSAWMCDLFQPSVETGGTTGRIGNPAFASSEFVGLVTVMSGDGSDFFGSVLKGGLTAIGPQFTFEHNTVIHGSIALGGVNTNLIDVFSDGTITSFGIEVVTGHFWGSYSIANYASWINATGSTYVLEALLTSGTIKLGTSTNGASYNTGTGAISAMNIALTPANIDTNGGLQDPAIGAHYSNLQ